MPYSKLREYKGKGTFEFKTEMPLEEEANFSLYFYSNAMIKVKASFILSQIEVKAVNEKLKSRPELSLNGILFDDNDESNNIGTISIEKLVVVSRSELNHELGKALQFELLCLSNVGIIYSNKELVSVEIHYGLTNFVFWGCEYSEKDGSFFLDKFNAEINNLAFLFKKIDDYGDIESKLKTKKGCHVTSEAIVNQTFDESDKAELVVTGVTELLSLATRNFVRPIYEDYFYNGALIKTILKPVLTASYNNANQLINVIPNPDICVLKNFLETTYGEYEKFKDDLNLKSVINLYLISRFALFTEAKFLLAVVSLESLLASFEEYEKNNGRPIETGLTKKTEKSLTKALREEGIELEKQVINRIASSIAYPHTTFQEKLIPLLKMFDVKFSSEDMELINLRNTIAHTGKFPKEYNSRIIVPNNELNRLTYFLDRILLSTLGYKNKPFLNIFNEYREEKLS